ncbi:MAG: sugar O-acetyltransferase [Solobacterium sp.]|nr:sugar O-acetyltransferase [Solobacterium sp.]MCH4223138.1 sugar O-acetyltransferase [Solobacterium sp.]MCH4266537.1 sugar O-acetyltransferase [Solobacterium sp.]
MNEQIHSGDLYNPNDSDVTKEQDSCLELMYQFNQTHPTEYDKRGKLLKQMLCDVGEGCCILPPFTANWGGHFLHLGDHVYINFGLTLVDDTHIYIGDCTMLGPNVTITVAGHPVLPELRGEHPWQYNLPVHIGKNCWIGAGVVILPGVTIGDHSVIGAGSIVVKDIPADTVAVGNPCHVLRPISEHDEEYYFRDRKIKPMK